MISRELPPPCVSHKFKLNLLKHPSPLKFAFFFLSFVLSRSKHTWKSAEITPFGFADRLPEGLPSLYASPMSTSEYLHTTGSFCWFFFLCSILHDVKNRIHTAGLLEIGYGVLDGRELKNWMLRTWFLYIQYRFGFFIQTLLLLFDPIIILQNILRRNENLEFFTKNKNLKEIYLIFQWIPSF